MVKNDLDRRVRRTRKLLQEALISLILEKGYEKVIVQDIIDRANVGRATFYAHFYDKEDLLLSEFEMLHKEFEETLGDLNPSVEHFWHLTARLFQHATEYHRVYKAVVGKQSGQIMQEHLHTYLIYLIDKYFDSQKPAVPKAVIAYYLSSSLIALLTWWLDNDLPYPASRMAQIYQDLVKPGINHVYGD